MTGSVCGYVVRADNEMPLRNAMVTVSGRAGAPGMAPLTDGTGWFVLDGLSPGNWLVRAKGPNDETGETTVPIFNDAFTNVTIVVEPLAVRARSSPLPVGRSTTARQPGALEGHVIDANTRQPVESATVILVRGPGPAPGIAPLTDSDGWFALDGLMPGAWVLRALGPNEQSGETTVHVSSAATATVTIAVGDSVQDIGSLVGVSHATERIVNPSQPGAVEGHVVSAESGLPVDSATVTIVRGAGPAPDIAPITDSAGWFALDGLPPVA